MPHDWRARRPNAARLRRGLILQIRITIDRDFARRFKHVEIRRYIDIEKLSVDLEETFGVSETWKLRKIVRFDFSQTRWTNFGKSRGFVESESARHDVAGDEDCAKVGRSSPATVFLNWLELRAFIRVRITVDDLDPRCRHDLRQEQLPNLRPM